MEQAIQIAGAVLILIAYVLAQMKVLSPQATSYLVLNLVGSVILAVLALLDDQLGFLLLEGVWAVVTAIALGRKFLNGH